MGGGAGVTATKSGPSLEERGGCRCERGKEQGCACVLRVCADAAKGQNPGGPATLPQF